MVGGSEESVEDGGEGRPGELSGVEAEVDPPRAGRQDSSEAWGVGSHGPTLGATEYVRWGGTMVVDDARGAPSR